MEQLSEKVFFAGAVVELLAWTVLVVVALRRARGGGRRPLAAAVGGALCLAVAAAYLTAVATAELLGDWSLLRALVGPWGDITRAVLRGTGTVLVVTALVGALRRRD